MQTYRGIGIMSGTSHDGLDLAACTFAFDGNQWSYKLDHAETIAYSDTWKNRLLGLLASGEEEISKTDIELGELIGTEAARFMAKYSFKADFVASHGHTIFHQPEKKLTLQIGNGQLIADRCGIRAVNDFRTQDVKMGGQGAPLVPIGDKLLFAEYDYCLNLGGIANISYDREGERIAYDICPVNMVLNMLAERLGKPFDDKGKLAGQGELIPAVKQKLESLLYYQLSPPKSLGREWVESNVFPLLDKGNVHDLLATMVEHIAIRIADEIQGKKKVLVSGGGTYNTHLIERLKKYSKAQIKIPQDSLINYKEALVFAFLGLLRLEGINNVLASVTGAPEDHCSGVIYIPKLQ